MVYSESNTMHVHVQSNPIQSNQILTKQCKTNGLSNVVTMQHHHTTSSVSSMATTGSYDSIDTNVWNSARVQNNHTNHHHHYLTPSNSTNGSTNSTKSAWSNHSTNTSCFTYEDIDDRSVDEAPSSEVFFRKSLFGENLSFLVN